MNGEEGASCISLKKPTVYTPQEKNICLYDKLYSQYLLLGEKTEAYQHLTDK